MKLATQMKEALEGVTDPGCESSRGGICRCCATRTEPANAGLTGVTAEDVARMDWAAELTVVDIYYLKLGLKLARHSAEAFQSEASARAIGLLLGQMERLPWLT